MHETLSDEHAMRLALDQASLAAQMSEVPVGAVVLHQGRLLAVGHNRPIHNHDPTAHAEIVALRAAAQLLGNYRLPECELFVTLEPCAMCAAAMLHARLKRVVFGAADPKTGCAGSVLNVFDVAQLNHQTTCQGGVLAEESAKLLREFFALRRAQARLQ
jgi:tRNA(adenine34) deaminase